MRRELILSIEIGWHKARELYSWTWFRFIRRVSQITYLIIATYFLTYGWDNFIIISDII